MLLDPATGEGCFQSLEIRSGVGVTSGEGAAHPESPPSRGPYTALAAEPRSPRPPWQASPGPHPLARLRSGRRRAADCAQSPRAQLRAGASSGLPWQPRAFVTAHPAAVGGGCRRETPPR